MWYPSSMMTIRVFEDVTEEHLAGLIASTLDEFSGREILTDNRGSLGCRYPGSSFVVYHRREHSFYQGTPGPLALTVGLDVQEEPGKVKENLLIEMLEREFPDKYSIEVRWP